MNPMQRTMVLVSGGLLLCLPAVAETWRFEVAADAPRVVSCPVDKGWGDRMATQKVVAIGRNGEETAVPWVLDESGWRPELVWLANGCRSFALRDRKAGETMPKPRTDLVADATGAETISVGNSFFGLEHPVTGDGGFPKKLLFARSGSRDDVLYFMDQFVRKSESGGLDIHRVRGDGNSSARLVFSSPLRAVVEVKARVADIEAVYRYVYSAWSPLVRVDLKCSQDSGRNCAEAWTIGLGWPRESPRYSTYLTKSMDALGRFQEKDKPSHAFSDRWVALTDGTNMVGAASVFGAVGWDASSSFDYYLLAQRDGWSTPSMMRSALLYLGPKQERDGLDRAFEGVCPLVRAYRDDLQWVPTEQLDVRPGMTLLEGRGIRLAFDAAERGFDCIGIENRLNRDPAAFGGSEPGRAGFWSLMFWKDGSPTNALTLDNLAPCDRKVTREGEALVFDWCGLALGDEPDAVDVRAKVSLAQGGTAAEWRLAVKNRSKRWGLAETSYPLLRNLVRPLEADVLMPKGNWAGRIVRSYQSQSSSLQYPSSLGAQIQTCAYMLGGTGFQVTALDGRGQSKYLDFDGFDFALRYPCPGQGVPGRANAPDFAVETAAFSGDWWRMAKRYRSWATRQKWASKGPLNARVDFNRQLGDVGYWMKNDGAGGAPSQVSNLMAHAFAAFPGIPLGLHWYCWQTCPFDHNYPDIFPERPGVRETVAWLKKNGVLVMPYVNGRLWDSARADYAEAVPSACKCRDGTIALEEYGSGAKFAPMCPVAGNWRRALDAFCDKMVDCLGVNALYLDQVSAAEPAPCHDKTHGHPLGGGAHWTEGYRELLKPIRAKAVKRGVALTAENAAEPYMDSFDAHLTWFGHSRDDVPMLPAVYSGYTVYFSSVSEYSGKDTLDSFCAQQGRDFIFGCQLGWNDPWILDDEHVEHRTFVTRLCRERIAHKDFFLTGELLGELPTPAGVPMVEVQWKRIGMYYDSERFRMPAVMGAVWRNSEDTARYVVLVNISGETQTFAYGTGSTRKTVTLSPRSVMSEVSF